MLHSLTKQSRQHTPFLCWVCLKFPAKTIFVFSFVWPLPFFSSPIISLVFGYFIYNENLKEKKKAKFKCKNSQKFL
jgi:di/tricarboxylate transporter